MRRNLHDVIFILLFFSLAILNEMFADTVYLKNGSKVSGSVISRTDEAVIILLNDRSEQVLPQNNVERIEFSFTIKESEKIASKDGEKPKVNEVEFSKFRSLSGSLEFESLPLGIRGSSGYGLGAGVTYLQSIPFCLKRQLCPHAGIELNFKRFSYTLPNLQIEDAFWLPSSVFLLQWSVPVKHFRFQFNAGAGIFYFNTSINGIQVKAVQPIVTLGGIIHYSLWSWLPGLLIQLNLYLENRIFPTIALGQVYEINF